MQPLEANFTADTSGLVPCQMPVYAVVDKTRKKITCQPAYIAEAADEREERMRNAAQGDDDTRNIHRTHKLTKQI